MFTAAAYHSVINVVRRNPRSLNKAILSVLSVRNLREPQNCSPYTMAQGLSSLHSIFILILTIQLTLSTFTNDQCPESELNVNEEKGNGDVVPAEPEEPSFIFEKIGADDLHISRHGGWLESRFHFRFANWNPMDPKRRQFGALHVLNDDIVAPNNGFGFHPHRDQEIFSYVLEGELSHKDSQGNEETLSRGAIQFMSAGKGVYHSEMNQNKKKRCRFLQTWIYPNRRNLDVQYGSHQFTEKERTNKLLHIISGEVESAKGKFVGNCAEAAPIALHQDVNVFVSELEYGKKVQFELKEGRQVYVVCPEGTVRINDQLDLETRAAVRVYGEALLDIEATYNVPKNESGPSAHLFMIEMQSTKN